MASPLTVMSKKSDGEEEEELQCVHDNSSADRDSSLDSRLPTQYRHGECSFVHLSRKLDPHDSNLGVGIADFHLRQGDETPILRPTQAKSHKDVFELMTETNLAPMEDSDSDRPMTAQSPVASTEYLHNRSSESVSSQSVRQRVEVYERLSTANALMTPTAAQPPRECIPPTTLPALPSALSQSYLSGSGRVNQKQKRPEAVMESWTEIPFQSRPETANGDVWSTQSETLKAQPIHLPSPYQEPIISNHGSKRDLPWVQSTVTPDSSSPTPAPRLSSSQRSGRSPPAAIESQGHLQSTLETKAVIGRGDGSSSWEQPVHSVQEQANSRPLNALSPDRVLEQNASHQNKVTIDKRGLNTRYQSTTSLSSDSEVTEDPSQSCDLDEDTSAAFVSEHEKPRQQQTRDFVPLSRNSNPKKECNPAPITRRPHATTNAYSHSHEPARPKIDEVRNDSNRIVPAQSVTRAGKEENDKKPRLMNEKSSNALHAAARSDYEHSIESVNKSSFANGLFSERDLHWLQAIAGEYSEPGPAPCLPMSQAANRSPPLALSTVPLQQSQSQSQSMRNTISRSAPMGKSAGFVSSSQGLSTSPLHQSHSPESAADCQEDPRWKAHNEQEIQLAQRMQRITLMEQQLRDHSEQLKEREHRLDTLLQSLTTKNAAITSKEVAVQETAIDYEDQRRRDRKTSSSHLFQREYICPLSKEECPQWQREHSQQGRTLHTKKKHHQHHSQNSQHAYFAADQHLPSSQTFAENERLTIQLTDTVRKLQHDLLNEKQSRRLLLINTETMQEQIIAQNKRLTKYKIQEKIMAETIHDWEGKHQSLLTQVESLQRKEQALTAQCEQQQRLLSQRTAGDVQQQQHVQSLREDSQTLVNYTNALELALKEMTMQCKSLEARVKSEESAASVTATQLLEVYAQMSQSVELLESLTSSTDNERPTHLSSDRHTSLVEATPMDLMRLSERIHSLVDQVELKCTNQTRRTQKAKHHVHKLMKVIRLYEQMIPMSERVDHVFSYFHDNE